MQLLLVPQHQVSSCKTAAAGGTLKGLLVCVGTFVSFQVFESGERSGTYRTDVRPGLAAQLGGAGALGGGHFFQRDAEVLVDVINTVVQRAVVLLLLRFVDVA